MSKCLSRDCDSGHGDVIEDDIWDKFPSFAGQGIEIDQVDVLRMRQSIVFYRSRKVAATRKFNQRHALQSP